jgi:hypothetical protein
MDRAARMLREMDGRVDALGLGGCNLYYRTRTRRYPFPAGQYLAGFARETPLTDGEGVKAHVEPGCVAALGREMRLDGLRVLFTAYLDRPELAWALAEAGALVWAGDPYFSSGLPLIPPVPVAESLAPLFMPLLARVPLRLLYPLGGAQGRWGSTPLGPQGFGLVAGEFHLMRRRMPRHLQGTTILASSLGERDARELKERGAPRVFATMPSMGGTRFGANAVEAALLASGHLDPAKGNYQEAWERSGLPPGVLQEVLP